MKKTFLATIITGILSISLTTNVFATAYVLPSSYKAVVNNRLRFLVNSSYTAYSSKIVPSASKWNDLSRTATRNQPNVTTVSGSFENKSNYECLILDSPASNAGFDAAYNPSAQINFNGKYVTTPIILLNSSTIGKISSNQAQSAIMHEMGHALGLGENSYNSKAIMYNYTSSNIAFATDDVDSLQYIYGGNSLARTANNNAEVEVQITDLDNKIDESIEIIIDEID